MVFRPGAVLEALEGHVASGNVSNGITEKLLTGGTQSAAARSFLAASWSC
jgi:hypothetical protein